MDVLVQGLFKCFKLLEYEAVTVAGIFWSCIAVGQMLYVAMKIPNTPRCSIGYTPSRVKFQSMPVSKNFKMYKMNSRNRGITAANAILRISCFIFRTVIAIFVQYYGIFDENRKKTDFLFCL